MKNFLNIPKERVLNKGEYFFIIKDKFPVSPGHVLIISNEPKLDYFDLSEAEQSNLPVMISMAKKLIETDFSPDGYNIGMNCGIVAGQTVLHFHCHLIPRYRGDMKNPEGGIRHCVEGKGYYNERGSSV